MRIALPRRTRSAPSKTKVVKPEVTAKPRRRDSGAIQRSGAFELGLDPAERLGVSTSVSAAVVGQRHFGHRLGDSGRSGGARRHRPRAPSARGRSAAPTPPDCRACRRWSAPRPARRARDRTPRSAGRSARASTCGMSPRQTIAPSASAGTAAMPAFSEVDKPVGEIRIVHELHRRGRRARASTLVALMAGDDDHRPGARGERLLGGDAHQRPAADLGQQLVRPAHAGRAAGGEDDARRCAGPSPAPARRAAAAA